MIGRPTEFYTEHARIVKMREDQPTALPKAARGAVRLAKSGVPRWALAVKDRAHLVAAGTASPPDNG